MKQILLILAVLTSSFCAKAQFILTADGWATETGKQYYVTEIPGSQQELYAKAKVAFTQIYKSAKDVLSYSEPDIIKANGFTDTPFLKQWGRTAHFNMTYSLTVLFKDGKIRFDAPSIGSLYSLDGRGIEVPLYMGKGGGSGLSSFGHIFKKNGDVRYKDAKQSIEEYFNNLIGSIITAIENPTVDEDW